MDDIVLRPRLPARLTPLVALKVDDHSVGFACEAGLAGCIHHSTLNRHRIGKLALFGKRHGQRLPDVKRLEVRDQTIDDRLCAPTVANRSIRRRRE